MKIDFFGDKSACTRLPSFDPCSNYNMAFFFAVTERWVRVCEEEFCLLLVRSDSEIYKALKIDCPYLILPKNLMS